MVVAVKKHEVNAPRADSDGIKLYFGRRFLNAFLHKGEKPKKVPIEIFVNFYDFVCFGKNNLRGYFFAVKMAENGP